MPALRELLPWRGIPSPLTAWKRAPATLSYALGTSLLFLSYVVAFGRDRGAVPRALYRFFVFEVPALFTDPLRTAVNLLTSVWPTYHPIQLVYVLALLFLFVAPFEAREGSRRTVLVFYASSILGGIGASVILHGIRAFGTAPWIEQAWDDAWVGGSSGCFGVLGAMAARAPRPWAAVLIVLLWEANVEWWHLRNYTPVFHLLAFAVGFGMMRRRPDPATPGTPAP